MRDVANMSDKVLVMDRGSVVAFDTPDEIFKKREMLRNIGLSTTPSAVLFDKLDDRGIHIESAAQQKLQIPGSLEQQKAVL